MKKLTLILAAMVLTASQAFGQCGKCGYEVKAENAYTNYNVRYASNPMDAKHYTTDRLRGEFAIEKVFCSRRGKLDIHHVRPLPHWWC